jgi:hypothetical protein
MNASRFGLPLMAVEKIHSILECQRGEDRVDECGFH